jgi:hypothetical protein
MQRAVSEAGLVSVWAAVCVPPGGDGYCGWATALHLSARNYEVCIVDNLCRYAALMLLGGLSHVDTFAHNKSGVGYQDISRLVCGKGVIVGLCQPPAFAGEGGLLRRRWMTMCRWCVCVCVCPQRVVDTPHCWSAKHSQPSAKPGSVIRV